jgi:hypothetical protein
MPTEEKDYSEQLKKLEKINALKQQRDSDSTQVRRSARGGDLELAPSPFTGSPRLSSPVVVSNQQTDSIATARRLLMDASDQQYNWPKRDISIYVDHNGLLTNLQHFNFQKLQTSVKMTTSRDWQGQRQKGQQQVSEGTLGIYLTRTMLLMMGFYQNEQIRFPNTILYNLQYFE